MSNVTVFSTSWASAHRNWTEACESRYDYLRRCLTPEERETAEITQLVPHHRDTIHGREVMVWRATVEKRTTSGGTIIVAADLLDDLPRDQAAPSVRAGLTPPTPAP